MHSEIISKQKTLVPESPALAMALSNFGHFYYYQGRYIEAEPLQKQALEIFEKALGPGHPDVATALDNLAELYRIQANFDEAEKLFKQSLDIKEKKLGSNHPKVSESLRGLAQVKLDINIKDAKKAVFSSVCPLINSYIARGTKAKRNG